MANVKNLQMSADVLAHPNISVEKALFGLSQKVVYAPTQSAVKGFQYEYAPDEGERLERLLTTPQGKLEAAVKTAGRIEHRSIGNVHVEACFSADGQFAAIQVYRFYDLQYHPSGSVKFFEGPQAALIRSVF